MRLKVAAAALAVAVAGPPAVAGASGYAAAGQRTTPVTAHASRYGTVLFDGKGRSIYLFAKDRGGKSSCYGACAKAWPPLLTKGSPRAGKGARKSLLGTTRRRDGTRQVTYAGHPLYGFSGDTKRGQITCQNVSQFGGKWLVVSAAGKAVH